MKNIVEQFNQIATDYDKQRPQLVPGFYDYYGASLAVLNYSGKAPRVLDLGCGTGLLSAFIVERYPEAELTLIDVASNMVDIARERFKSRPFATTFIVGDYTTYSFEKEFDIIVSGLSIHHLSAKDKENLYKKSYSLLSNEGEFLNIDQVLSPTDELEENYTKLWREMVQNSTLSDEEIEKAFERTKLDDPSTLVDQLDWLRKAGFKNVDSVYKYWYFCSMYGQK